MASISNPSPWVVALGRADPVEFWVLASLALAIAIGAFIGSFYFLVRKRIIEDTPTSKIRSAAQGYTELAGHARWMEGPPIIAPLSGTACTWYSYVVEEKVSTYHHSRRQTRWATVDRGVSAELFLLVDDTGQCVIDPDGAQVTPSVSDVWYGSTATPPRRIPRNLRPSAIAIATGRYRYKEARIHPGDPLYAIGVFKTIGGAGVEFNVHEAVREIVRAWKRNTGELLAKFDQNRDGAIDLEEWESVRDAARDHVLKWQAKQKNLPPIHIMCTTNDMRRPYLLSALAQPNLIKKYRFYAAGLMTTFFLAAIAFTWMLGARLMA